MTQAKADEWLHSDKGAPWKHRDAGGGIGGQGIMNAAITGLGGNAAAQNPMVASYLKRFAAMPEEQLQEYASRMPPGSPQGAMIQQALQMKHMQPPAAAQGQGTGIMAQGAAPGQGGAGAPQQPAPAPYGDYTQMAAARGGGILRRDDGGATEAPQVEPGFEPASGLPGAINAFADKYLGAPPERQYPKTLGGFGEALGDTVQQGIHAIGQPAARGIADLLTYAHGGLEPGRPMSPESRYATSLLFDEVPTSRGATLEQFDSALGRNSEEAQGAGTAALERTHQTAEKVHKGNSANEKGEDLQEAANTVPLWDQFKRGGIARRAMGGSELGMPMSMADPWWERAESYQATRYIDHPSMGRADHFTTMVPAGSYVVPADVVAGLSDGNSLGGAKLLDRAFSTGPHGIPLARGARGRGPPPAPRLALPRPEEAGFKAGGVPQGQGEMVPVKLSGGEVVIHPQALHAKFGPGKQAHRAMDEFVVQEREKFRKKLAKLPGPVKE